MKKKYILIIVAIITVLPLSLAIASTVRACGGLFCQNSSVDQNAERIIFSQNHDGTITALIQIIYTGSADDFSWILPIPVPIGTEDLEVPDTAVNAFTEIETATTPVFLPPPLPECAQVEFEGLFAADSVAEESGRVDVFASGEVGPYGFDVIGSEDPEALIHWLRDNDYRVTEEMEPLTMVYVDEGFSFLAMQLLPEEDANSIQPIQITYPSEMPMIPLRLTAVAANPDMSVQVYFYADRQAVPVNYAHMEIPDRDLTFFTFGGNNYRQLMGERADEFGGQAFITEFAAPTRELFISDPLLQDLGRRFAYITRLNTVISPEEMTVDPVFAYDPQAKDVSNVHDLTEMTGLYDCEREVAANTNITIPFIGPIFSQGNEDDGEETQGQLNQISSQSSLPIIGGILIGMFIMALVGTALFVGVLLGRKGKT